MILPVHGTITQTFDTPVDYIVGRTHHEAIDIVTDGSQRIYAIAPCTVVKIVNTYDYLPNKDFGNQVWVEYINGYRDRFCHLKRDSMPQVGTKLNTGDVMGATGQTGYRFPIDTFHTHWERYNNDKRIDPLDENNQPPQKERKKRMKLFDKAIQLVSIDTPEGDEFYVIWLDDASVEHKRRVKSGITATLALFADNGKYNKWETQEQRDSLSRMPEGAEFSLVTVLTNRPELAKLKE